MLCKVFFINRQILVLLIMPLHEGGCLQQKELFTLSPIQLLCSLALTRFSGTGLYLSLLVFLLSLSLATSGVPLIGLIRSSSSSYPAPISSYLYTNYIPHPQLAASHTPDSTFAAVFHLHCTLLHRNH